MTEDPEELGKLLKLRDTLDAAAVPPPPPVSLSTVRALKNHDNRLWSPVECLTDCIRDIQKGDVVCDKLFILRIDTSDEKFNVGYNASRIKASEILAAMEIAKAILLQEMGYTA